MGDIGEPRKWLDLKPFPADVPEELPLPEPDREEEPVPA